MADKKISELTELTSAQIVTGADVIPIVDTDAGQTKKVKVGSLPFVNTVQSVAGAYVAGTGNVRFGVNQETTGTTMFVDTANRRVGIRTDAPQDALDVNGTTRVRGNFGVGNNGQQMSFFVSGDSGHYGGPGAIYTRLGRKNVAINANTNNDFHHALVNTPSTGIDDRRSLNPVYTVGSNRYGLLVKDSSYRYVHVSGSALSGIQTNPITLLSAIDSNKANVVKEVTALISNKAAAKADGDRNKAVISTGIFMGSTISNVSGQTFSQTASIPRSVINKIFGNETVIYERDAPSVASIYQFGQDLVLSAAIDNVTGVRVDDLEFKFIIKYNTYDLNNSFVS